jgi:hypothetical protein
VFCKIINCPAMPVPTNSQAMTTVINTLEEISTPPVVGDAFDGWLDMKDAIDFLERNAQQDEIVVYAVMQHAYLHTVLVPASLLDQPDIEDLLSWDCNAYSSWGVEIRYSTPPSVFISQPLNGTGSKTLDKGEQLVFARSFEGRIEEDHYCEILQKFVHVLNIHFLPERNAYCRLDRHGDIEDVIKIVEIPKVGDDFGGTIVTFNRAALDEYAVLTDSALLRMFDFPRFRPAQFSGWTTGHDAGHISANDLFYRLHIEQGYASYLRGVQIAHPAISKEAITRRLDPASQREKQYVSFIANDWKNRIVRQISCAPGETANYFTESSLPFEMSPAFFRAEVLSKYKADGEKYRLEDRTISCRGAWHLQTFDINEVGQVHTYLVYLRNLPYEEQLYWKAFNEPPKGPISKRAFRTDFEGCWDSDYAPVASLKYVLNELNRERVPWWKPRSEKLFEQLHYPTTGSADEWANELLKLDQLVIEGFDAKWLRNRAQALGRSPEPSFGSLRLVEECLTGLTFTEQNAKKVVEPLKAAHELRSKVKGHASSAEAVAAIRKQVLTQHGSYKQHFEALCGQCDESMRIITEAFGKIVP